MRQSFIPMNELESVLVRAKIGQAPVSELIITLLESELLLSSGSEVSADGTGFEPLIFPKEKLEMVACFTDQSRIGDYAAMAPYYLTMKGRDLLHRIPPGHGVVVNPGQEIGFDISPDGISKALRDFPK